MSGGSAGLRRWTQRFTIASAGSFVLFVLATGLGVDQRIVVRLGVFGFLCPMIFGMAYLLLPAYVGQTLVDRRLAGIHFVAAYGGTGLLVGEQLVGGSDVLLTVGALAWTGGIVVFVGSIAASVGPAIVAEPDRLFRSGDRPRRSTRLASAAIPVAIGYLLVGTIGLLAVALPALPGSTTFAQVVHFYAVGFGALLIYALGARLLIGFFHVALPRALVWLVLTAGSLAPIFLGAYLWVDPWFRLGAVLAAIAMVGYATLIALVVRRTDRVRVGLSGIVLGAAAGVVAVAASLPVAFGDGSTVNVAAHGTLVLAGFFPLTIVGYAYLFFPVTTGQFIGATGTGARTTIGSLAAGVVLQTVGIAMQYGPARAVGVIASILGGVGYAYLLGRRFLDR